MQREQHECKAPGCHERVAMRMLMCLAHWRMVPDDLQQAVWRAYQLRHRGGQYEREHYNACKAAIDAVRRQIDQGSLAL